MTHKIAPLALAMILAGCGQADGELNPGNWNTKVSISKFDVPGAPPAMAGQIQQMLNKEQSNDACMTAAQAASGVRDFSSSMQEGDCKMDDFKQGGGKMSGKLVCQESAMGAATMQMEGTYAPDKVTMTTIGEVSDAKLPGGKATITMSMASERTGECKS